MTEESLIPSTEKTEEESRREQAERLVTFLRRTESYEYIKSLFDNANQERPSFEDFKDFLGRINGIARDISPTGRSHDGEHVRLSGFVEPALVPKHEDKEGLLEYAYDAAAELEHEDIAIMLPAVINAVHLFADSNGRTSRVMHTLLEEHSSEDEALEKMRTAAGINGRFDSMNINPGLISMELEKIVLSNHGWIFPPDEVWSPSHDEFALGVASVENHKLDQTHESFSHLKKFVDNYTADRIYLTTAINEALGKERVAQLLTDRYTTKGLISPLLMQEKLTQDEWGQIFAHYYALKAEHVKTLVDIFKQPKDSTAQEGQGRLADLFKQKIKENFEELNP